MDISDSEKILFVDSAVPVPDVDMLKIISSFAAYVWVCGTAAMFIYAVVSYIILRLRLRTAVRSESGVWLSEEASTPFVLGFIKPRIYLPFGLAGGTAEFATAHERAHIKRRDHLIKPLGFMLLAVYWFNPLIWAAYILLCRDIELACDEKVIGKEGESYRKAYSEALLECSAKKRRIAACPLAFGEVGVRHRIKNVLNYRKPAFWIIIISLAICAVVAACFLTNPVRKAEEPEETESEFIPLSAMSIDECVEFANEYGIEIPVGWSREAFGGYVKSIILMVEENPRGLHDGQTYTEPEISADGTLLIRAYWNLYPDYTKQLWNAVRKYYNFTELDFPYMQSNFTASVSSIAYIFGELLYVSGSSVYIPSVKDNYLYKWTDGRFIVTDLNSQKEIISINYSKNDWVDFSDEEWRNFFDGEYYIPDISKYTNEKGCTREKLSNGVSRIITNSQKYVVISDKYRLFNMNGEYWLMELNASGKALYIIEFEIKETFSGLTLDDVIELSGKEEALTLSDFLDRTSSKVTTVGDVSYDIKIDSHWVVKITNNSHEMYLDEPIPEGADITLMYYSIEPDEYGYRFNASDGEIEQADIRNLSEVLLLIEKHT